MVIRHTLKAGGLETRADAMGRIYCHTHASRATNTLGRKPPRIWLNFLATSGRRARLNRAYENYGEVHEEPTDIWRFFASASMAVGRQEDWF